MGAEQRGQLGPRGVPGRRRRSVTDSSSCPVADQTLPPGATPLHKSGRLCTAFHRSSTFPCGQRWAKPYQGHGHTHTAS